MTSSLPCKTCLHQTVQAVRWSTEQKEKWELYTIFITSWPGTSKPSYFFENCITQDTETKLIYAFIRRGFKYGNSTVVNIMINTNQAKNTSYICSVHIWNRATQCVVVVVGASIGIFFACLCCLQAHPHLHRIHSHTHTYTPNFTSHSCPALLFVASPIKKLQLLRCKSLIDAAQHKDTRVSHIM